MERLDGDSSGRRLRIDIASDTYLWSRPLVSTTYIIQSGLSMHSECGYNFIYPKFSSGDG